MIVKSTTDQEAAVHLKQTFAAPREKVFRAWTEPEELKKWWGPAGSIVPHVEIDLQVGGSYRVGIQFPPEDVFYLSGTYREVQPPEKLVFTWRWERPDMDSGESLVTVEFHDLGNSTVVALTHEKFPNRDIADHHNQGWNNIFENFGGYIAREEVGSKE